MTKNAITYPTLGLAMIMKNEEHNLPKSLLPLAKFFDEIIVVDTGSNDKSVEIANLAGAKILHFTWQNDFAAARNFGLKAATTDFILWLDADNSIDYASLKILKDLLIKNNPVILLATEEVQPQGEKLWQKRVFPNHPDVFFQGAIHEQLVHPPYLPILESNAIIQHWGYSNPIVAKEKGERNLTILLEKAENNNFYWLYQTGRTYFNLRHFKEAEKFLQKAIENKQNPPLWGHAMILLSQCQNRLGLLKDAEKTLYSLIKQRPDYGLGYYYLGRLLYDFGEDEQASQFLETSILLGTGDPIWGANQQINDFRAAFLLGRIWQKRGKSQPAKQAFKLASSLEPQNPEPGLALAEIALEAGHPKEAKKYIDMALTLAPKNRKALQIAAKINSAVF